MRLIQALTALLMIGFYSHSMSDQEFGIPYQKQPRENLMVGGQPSLEQFIALKEAGFTTIINLRPVGEFDDFDEWVEVSNLGMEYVHIPIKDIKSITAANAAALHEAITHAPGPVLLHCTVGWRAGGLYAIEHYLLHTASEQEALTLAAEAHMDHAVGDVEKWIQANQ